MSGQRTSKDYAQEHEPTPKIYPNPIPKFDKSLPEIAEELGWSLYVVRNQYESAVKKILRNHPEMRDWL